MLRVNRCIIWEHCYTSNLNDYRTCTCLTDPFNHSSLVATLEVARYSNVYESRKYSRVAIVNQNIYCFGGGCAAHLESAQVSYLCLSKLSVQSSTHSVSHLTVISCAILLCILLNKWLKIEMFLSAVIQILPFLLD